MTVLCLRHQPLGLGLVAVPLPVAVPNSPPVVLVPLVVVLDLLPTSNGNYNVHLLQLLLLLSDSAPKICCCLSVVPCAA